MKHKQSNRILGRVANHRKALMRNMVSSLLRHGSIVTTEAKGKELRRHVEPLITKAKGELTLARRRDLLAELMHKEDLSLLLEAAAAAGKRPGGYVRLTRLPITRSDAARTVRIDIIDQQ